uniref:Mitochondrial ribosomal protein L39 n=1 Tax=Astyanax mexicanus TaxID=7994 RepID=A0A8B9HRT5_ASTMX
MSSAEVRSWRSTLFSKEQERQRSLYPRIEKIEVTMQGAGVQGTLLVMNKGLSTPYSCSRHLTDWHVSSAALALVDGEPWHLHRPLTRSCSLTLLTFKDANPQLPNQAYWRSCAALLGQVLEGAFKEEYNVELLRIPEVPGTEFKFCLPNIEHKEVTYTYCALRINLMRITNLMINLTNEIKKIINIHRKEAIFANIVLGFFFLVCKQEEVEEKAAQSPNGTVSLYRCGHHVVLAGGPLVGRTGLCSQYEVTALHTVGEGPWGLQRRAQGLSLPVNLTVLKNVKLISEPP